MLKSALQTGASLPSRPIPLVCLPPLHNTATPTEHLTNLTASLPPGSLLPPLSSSPLLTISFFPLSNPHTASTPSFPCSPGLKTSLSCPSLLVPSHPRPHPQHSKPLPFHPFHTHMSTHISICLYQSLPFAFSSSRLFFTISSNFNSDWTGTSCGLPREWG